MNDFEELLPDLFDREMLVEDIPKPKWWYLEDPSPTGSVCICETSQTCIRVKPVEKLKLTSTPRQVQSHPDLLPVIPPPLIGMCINKFKNNEDEEEAFDTLEKLAKKNKLNVDLVPCTLPQCRKWGPAALLNNHYIMDHASKETNDARYFDALYNCRCHYCIIMNERIKYAILRRRELKLNHH